MRLSIFMRISPQVLPTRGSGRQNLAWHDQCRRGTLPAERLDARGASCRYEIPRGRRSGGVHQCCLLKYDQNVATTTAIARACNDEVHQMTVDYPNRFAGLATLPMQDIKAVSPNWNAA